MGKGLSHLQRHPNWPHQWGHGCMRRDMRVYYDALYATVHPSNHVIITLTL